MYQGFGVDISEMNARYELAPIETASWSAVSERLRQFADILDKEFAELGDIQDLSNEANDDNWPNGELPMKVFTAIGDLLGDIIVYCASESQRWNLPLPKILRIIMASNTSKSGEDGKPIKDPDNGKFLKGPNYWKPEPAIAHLLKYGGDGMLFHKSATGVITIEMWEPTGPDAVRLESDQVGCADLSMKDDQRQFGTAGEEH